MYQQAYNLNFTLMEAISDYNSGDSESIFLKKAMHDLSGAN